MYGKPSQTSAVGNPYLFTSRAYDSETGLYYYRARYYSPTLGRFLQTDPVGYSAGINWYAYCGNNPIGFIDPSGLCGKGNSWGFSGADFGQYFLNTLQGLQDTAIGIANLLGSGPMTNGTTPPFMGAGTTVIPGFSSPQWARDAIVRQDDFVYNGQKFFGSTAVTTFLSALTVEAQAANVSGSVAYRYVGSVEAEVAGSTGYVPNVTMQNIPKNVFYSPTEYATASEAQQALVIGKPTNVITVDASNATWNYAGNVANGTGTEMVTTQQLPVISVEPIR